LILAGDIGGTKTVIGLFTAAGGGDGRVRAVVVEDHSSRDHPGLEPLLVDFVARHARGATLEAACFGVAGPVVRGRSQITNLSWVVDAAELEAELGVPVVLLNDLEAMARGIAELGDEDLATLQAGLPAPEGNAALIAAGTGLGEAVLFRHRGHLVPSPSEGGHADLAARNDEEIDLLRFLLGLYGRADYERVVSGPGLVNCYRFTHEAMRDPHPDLLAAADPPAAIAAAALARACPACVRSLDLFVSVYGAEAGNLALKVMAVGGVYVGGGIAPKILPALAGGRFLAAFRDKGEAFARLMGSIPVRVILNPRTPLLGAARAGAARVGAAGRASRA
jgi:glucokinase